MSEGSSDADRPGPPGRAGPQVLQTSHVAQTPRMPEPPQLPHDPYDPSSPNSPHDAHDAHDALDAADRADCAVCAAWLATAPLASRGAAAAVASALVTWLAAGHPPSPIEMAAWLALGGLERMLAARVAFDAELFARLGDGRLAGLATLDRALRRVVDLPAAKAGRPLAPRIAGARRLHRRHAASVAALGALALVTVIFAWLPTSS